MDKKVFLLDKEMYNESDVMRFTEDDLEDMVSVDNEYFSDRSIIKLDANQYATPEDAIDCEGFHADSYYVLAFGFSNNEDRTFNLGDVVLITDTTNAYEQDNFTAHCIQKIETLKSDDSVQVEFVFAVDQNKENNVSYIVGEDRYNNAYHFGKVIGNILNG